MVWFELQSTALVELSTQAPAYVALWPMPLRLSPPATAPEIARGQQKLPQAAAGAAGGGVGAGRWSTPSCWS